MSKLFKINKNHRTRIIQLIVKIRMKTPNQIQKLKDIGLKRNIKDFYKHWKYIPKNERKFKNTFKLVQILR